MVNITIKNIAIITPLLISDCHECDVHPMQQLLLLLLLLTPYAKQLTHKHTYTSSMQLWMVTYNKSFATIHQ